MFLQSIKDNLDHMILPFWEGLIDKENGGFYGFEDYNLNLDKKAAKGCILNSRILWMFSNAYLVLHNESVIPYADQAFYFLKDHFIDKQYGGVYWSLNYNGEPDDDTKHGYNQAFAIYGLSSYYDATKNEEALKIAMDLFHLLESKWKDEYGYLEAFKRDFSPESNEKLSENGVMAEKTMNTMLHIFEAYTELYRVTKNEEVAKQMRWLLDIFANNVYNPKKHRLEVFFDAKMNSILDLHSYGHDIETSWLIDRGLEVLGDDEYTKKLAPITADLANQIYNVAYIDNSLVTECEKGKVLTSRVWWVQCESIIGFVNAYQKDKSKTYYLDAAKNIWNYVLENLVDKRPNSEWFWEVDENKKPNEQEPIVSPWKCPYHNGRMCFEMIRRIEHDS